MIDLPPLHLTSKAVLIILVAVAWILNLFLIVGLVLLFSLLRFFLLSVSLLSKDLLLPFLHSIVGLVLLYFLLRFFLLFISLLSKDSY